ncbi:hypothetical protein AB0M10_33020 [Streptomyces sp. NPDC051840]|uniref:hypothetical protein n=1 Tax=Streptomyces sp. NPDC051840 TaxID=3154752 RepID=UPI003427043E
MSADLTPDDGPTPDELAMAEDGFTSAARWMPQQMRHPLYAATRAHLAQHPMPQQRNRRAA